MTSQIGYNLLFNREIDLGHIILAQIEIKIKSFIQERRIVYYNYFIPDVNARFDKENCVPFYVHKKRIFSNITKQDIEKVLEKIPQMVYHKHMQVVLLNSLLNLYNASISGGEMDKEPQLADDPPMPTQVAKNPVFSERICEIIFDPHPIVLKKPTSNAFQKAPVLQ